MPIGLAGIVSRPVQQENPAGQETKPASQQEKSADLAGGAWWGGRSDAPADGTRPKWTLRIKGEVLHSGCLGFDLNLTSTPELGAGVDWDLYLDGRARGAAAGTAAAAKGGVGAVGWGLFGWGGGESAVGVDGPAAAAVQARQRALQLFSHMDQLAARAQAARIPAGGTPRAQAQQTAPKWARVAGKIPEGVATQRAFAGPPIYSGPPAYSGSPVYSGHPAGGRAIPALRGAEWAQSELDHPPLVGEGGVAWWAARLLWCLGAGEDEKAYQAWAEMRRMGRAGEGAEGRGEEGMQEGVRSGAGGGGAGEGGAAERGGGESGGAVRQHASDTGSGRSNGRSSSAPTGETPARALRSALALLADRAAAAAAWKQNTAAAPKENTATPSKQNPAGVGAAGGGAPPAVLDPGAVLRGLSVFCGSVPSTCAPISGLLDQPTAAGAAAAALKIGLARSGSREADAVLAAARQLAGNLERAGGLQLAGISERAGQVEVGSVGGAVTRGSVSESAGSGGSIGAVGTAAGADGGEAKGPGGGLSSRHTSADAASPLRATPQHGAAARREAALRLCGEASLLEPNWAAPRALAARIHAVAGEREKCAAEAEAAVQRNPHDRPSRRLMDECMTELGS